MKVLKSLLILMVLAGCSTTKTTNDSTAPSNRVEQVRNHLNTRGSDIQALEFAGAIISKRQGGSQRGNFELSMLQTDSLLLSIYMPLGNILIGALSASPDEFLYYDALRSEAIEGEPSAENMERILYIPLSHLDVAHLIRGEIPGGIEEFREHTNDDGLTSLVRSREGIIERVLYSQENQAISQYARKDDNGNTIVTVSFGEFETIEGTPIASVVNMNFPTADMALTLRCDQIILNQPASKYNFALPDGITRRRY